MEKQWNVIHCNKNVMIYLYENGIFKANNGGEWCLCLSIVCLIYHIVYVYNQEYPKILRTRNNINNVNI